MKGKARPFRVITPFGTRVIGTIKNGTLHKRVYRAKHYHREQHGWGMETSALKELERLRVPQIELEVIDEGVILKTTVAAYWSHGKAGDYGWNEQLFLEDRYWTAVHTAQNRAVYQLALFDQRQVAAK